MPHDAAPERILVWGTGAIGGTVAAYLRRADFEITAVDSNASQVRAIRARGLAITGPVETFTETIPIFAPDEVDGVWDTILLCVKALHTRPAVRQLERHLADDGVVVSLQNGFNELVISGGLGAARTMGAFINFGADVLEPGVIHFGGRGAVVVGELDGRATPRLARIRAALAHFEPETMTTENIWGYLWGKTGYGSLLFASALTEASIVEVLGSREARPALAALAREVTAVARAEGVEVMGFNGYDPAAFEAGADPSVIDASFAAMVTFNRRSAKTHSGVWRDIAVHHRKTEAEPHFTPVLELARRHGLAVPHVERLLVLMRDVETGVRRQSWDNLARLAGTVG